MASAIFFTCAAPRAQATADRQAPSGALAVVWAASEYALREPVEAAAALHVLARNSSDAATGVLTVRWSPEFAHAFTFMGSDPPAANVLIDGAGWGVAQVGGVPAGAELSIRLWFRVADGEAAPADDLFPRVQVLTERAGGDGMRVVGERLAVPLHAPERLKLRAQHALDRSAVAQLVEHAPFVPVTSRGVFGPAISFAVVLLLITGAGVTATIRATGRTG